MQESKIHNVWNLIKIIRHVKKQENYKEKKQLIATG